MGYEVLYRICAVLLLSCGCLLINTLDACYSFPSCPFFLCIFEVILTIHLAFFSYEISPAAHALCHCR